MFETSEFTPGIYTDVQVIPAMLRALRENPPSAGGMLSAYLPTPPVQVTGRKDLVRFREECKAIRQELEAAGRDERQAFETAATRIEEYLTDMPVPRHPGLVVFAAEERGDLNAAPLPERPATLVVWDVQPLLTPLDYMLDEHERVAVVLADRREARLFTIYLGAIEDQRNFESDDPGKSTVSGIAGNYAGHYQESVQRHLRRTAHAAVELLHSQPFDRLILGGPDDMATRLKDELPRPLRARFAGTLSIGMSATDAEVLDAARIVAEEIERRTEIEMVDELIAAMSTPRTELGLQPTLDAVSDHRVHQLVLASAFEATGAECSNCGRLVAGTGRCPACGAQTEPLPDLRERVVDRALEQGGRVEMASGEASTRLMDHDGIGGWTRY